MKRYQDEDIKKAKKLRKEEKYSFAHLQKITGIPSSTIRNWCNDTPIGTRWDTLLATNERKRKKLKESESSSVDFIKEIDTNLAKVFASLIYWCEGYSYPASNRLGLTNSDPDLMQIFINLLRKSFVLDESKFRAHLQIHVNHNYIKLRKFWSELLDVSESQFIKPTITKPNGGKHRKNYLGTCTIKYMDYRIQLKLIGIYEKFINKFKEKI